MLKLLYAILGFVLAIGILTTIHEFGHFIVARWMRVKVLRFSVGFGKPLLRWYDKLGTEYILATFPFGGYVSMLGENTENISEQEKHMAFCNKPVWARMLIIAAGPVFNLLFAVAAYWLVFVIGILSIAPILGAVPNGSIADMAGLKAGQEIVAINEHKVASWQDVSVALIRNLGTEDVVKISVVDPATKLQSEHLANLRDRTLDDGDSDLLTSLGMEPYDPTLPIIDKILDAEPAQMAGLQSGDVIIAVDGIVIATRTELSKYIRSRAKQTITLDIQRQQQTIKLAIIPRSKLIDGGEEVGFIGIQYLPHSYPKQLLRIQRLAPIPALVAAVVKTKEYCLLTFQILRKMLFKEISVRHVGGPIAIAQQAGFTISLGLPYFLSFLAWISISLGILNMLPIPILDGGQFLYCIIEAVTGRPIPDTLKRIGYKVGGAFLIVLMSLAFYNDLLRVSVVK